MGCEAQGAWAARLNGALAARLRHASRLTHLEGCPLTPLSFVSKQMLAAATGWTRL